MPAPCWCCPSKRCWHEESARHPGLEPCSTAAPGPRCCAARRSATRPDCSRGRARSSTTCASVAMRPCCEYTAQLDGVRAAAAGSDRAGVRGRRSRALTSAQHRRPGARHRHGDALPRAADGAGTAAGDHAGRRLRADHGAARRRRAVRARGHGSPSLHGDHGRRAGAHRRLPERVMCTPPRPDGTRRSGGAGRRQALRRAQDLQARRRAGHGRDGLRHRERCRGATRSSARATPGSRPPSRSLPQDAEGAALDLPAGPSEVLVIADDAARARVRCGRPAGPGRAQCRCAGDAGHDVAPLAEAVPTRSTGSCGRCRARHPAAVDRRTAGSSLVPDLATALRGVEPLRARAPDRADARSARAARRHPQCRLDVPRRLVAGIHGRLLLRHQPRAADLRLCARLQRLSLTRLPEAHDGAGTHGRGPPQPGPGGRDPGATSKAWMRTPTP